MGKEGREPVRFRAAQVCIVQDGDSHVREDLASLCAVTFNQMYLKEAQEVWKH